MSSEVPFPPPGLDELSNDEQIEYTAQPDDVSVPDWHMEIIEKRLARYEKDGMEGTPLEEFEKELFELLMKG
ncbi:MAG TPA: addiction module protein [Pyrinomonadaceae bacterium]|nr:addiction module protein [Pyrinomonadaceae bacterium]